ncbi:MAG: hypothetical protein J6I84_03020 [Bacilli bacterium]|nr:hypothetical protein [Bacilli bacterium]
MEQIKKNTETSNMGVEVKDPQDLENQQNMRIYGFEDSIAVAKTIFGGIHEILLRGELVFAYRNTASSNKKDLFQVIVVRDLRPFDNAPLNTYSISTITSGYTALIPHMPIEYLDEVVSDLEAGKVEKKIVENFKEIIKDLKK